MIKIKPFGVNKRKKTGLYPHQMNKSIDLPILSVKSQTTSIGVWGIVFLLIFPLFMAADLGMTLWVGYLIMFLLIIGSLFLKDFVDFSKVEVFENRIEMSWRWGMRKKVMAIAEISLARVFSGKETIGLEIQKKGQWKPMRIKCLNEFQLKKVAIFLKEKSIKVYDKEGILFEKIPKLIVPKDPKYRGRNAAPRKTVVKPTQRPS